ncbi:MAG: tetratricopeptide repeat protein, partial [Anaerolineae bacterium]
MWISGTYEDILMQARAHTVQGKFEEGISLYRHLVDRLSSLKPELWERRPELREIYHEGLAELAQIYHILGNFEQSLALYRQLGEREDPKSALWHQKAASVLIDMGHVEQGLDELRAEAMATPGSHEAWLIIGRECTHLGRWEEAEENLNRALRNATTQEDKQDVYLAFFELYRAQGRIEDAMAAWDQTRKEKEDPDSISSVYQMLIEHKQLERVRQYLERDPNALRRGFYQGLLEALAGRTQEAQRRWQKVAKMDPLEFEGGSEEWAEAALRTNLNPEKVKKVLEKTKNWVNATPRRAVLSAIAE